MFRDFLFLVNAGLVTEQKTISANPPPPLQMLQKTDLVSPAVTSEFDLGGIGESLSWRNDYVNFKYPGLRQYLQQNCKITP
jgi:hypothetical protein